MSAALRLMPLVALVVTAAVGPLAGSADAPATTPSPAAARPERSYPPATTAYDGVVAVTCTLDERDFGSGIYGLAFTNRVNFVYRNVSPHPVTHLTSRVRSVGRVLRFAESVDLAPGATEARSHAIVDLPFDGTKPTCSIDDAG